MTDRHCYGHPDRPRALLALAFPFMALGALVYVLWKKGHSLWDYPLVATAGPTSLASQVIFWAALIYWVTRYWGTALDALSSESCLIWRQGDDLRFSGGHRIKIAALRELRRKTDLRGKYILFINESGEVFRQSVMFTRETAYQLVAELSSLIAEDRKA